MLKDFSFMGFFCMAVMLLGIVIGYVLALWHLSQNYAPIVKLTDKENHYIVSWEGSNCVEAINYEYYACDREEQNKKGDLK